MNDNTTFWSPDPSRLVVALQPGERVVVVGSAWLRCLAGACEVHGHAVVAGAPRVMLHSTRALPPVSLRGVAPGAGDAAVLAAGPGWLRRGEKAVAELEAFDAADGLRSGARDAAQAWDDGADLPRARLAGCAAFRVGGDGGGLRPLLEPSAWAGAVRAIAAAGRAPCGVVVGAKGAGKSTFVRQLLNGLGRAALLELDVGQPSVGPPACLSLRVLDGPLLAPPHLCARELGDVKRRYFFGDNTPRDDPGGYLDAAAALHGLWLSELAPEGVPLVVNTCGWVTGLGAELLANLIRALRPTHVFAAGDAAFCARRGAPVALALDACDPRPHLRCLGNFADDGEHKRRRESEGDLAARRPAAPAARRALQLACYFAETLEFGDDGPAARNGALADPRGDVADAIARAAPRVADWRRLSVAYVGGAADFAPASRAEAAATLPWSLVGLARSADLPRDLVAAAGGVPAGGADGPGVWPHADWLQAAPCAGLALVTSAAAGAVRLWAPAASLDGCDVLLRGRLAPPVDLLYRGPARHGAFAFLSSESLDRDDLATAMKSRSNIGRKAHKADAAS